MTMLDTIDKVEVDRRHREPGDHDTFSHYVKKEAILEAAVEGKPARALCGKEWVPTKDEKRFDVCPKCKAIYESIPVGDDE